MFRKSLISLFVILTSSSWVLGQLVVDVTKEDLCLTSPTVSSITVTVTAADGTPTLNIIGPVSIFGQVLTVGVPFVFDNLGAGLPASGGVPYSVIVQDLGAMPPNPSFLQDVFINDVTPDLTGSVSTDNNSCTTPDGSVTLTVSGGSSPPASSFSFSWDDGPTTQNRTGLTGGSYTVTVTDDVSGCEVMQTFVIVDLNPTVVTLDPFSDVCIDAAPFALSGGLPSGGVYSGPGVSGGIFDPAVAGVGLHTITYTFTDACGPSSDTEDIVVNNIPTVSFGLLSGPYCEDDPTVLLTGNQAPNGSFSGPGITDNGNGSAIFDPAAAGPGSHNIIYIFTDANGCSNSDIQSVMVNAIPTVSIGGLNPDYCVDAGVIALTGSPLAPAGTWSTTAPAGLTDNGDGTATLDVALATAGTWDITYDYTDLNGCSASDLQTTTINSLPTASFAGLAGPYCENNPIITLTGSPLAPAGTWMTDAPGGLTDNGDGTADFDASLATPGTWSITYNYTDVNGCMDSDTQMVTINPIPSVSFTGLTSPYCEDDAVAALSGTPNAPPGIWSTTAPGGLTDNGDGTASFDPSLATPGTYDITYTYTDPIGCTSFDTQSVTVNGLPTANITGLSGTYCEADPVVTINGNPAAPAGTWSTTAAPAALTDNGDGTANFNPAIAGAGTWDITYDYVDVNGCMDTDTQSTTINSLPVVSFSGLAGPYCEDAGVVALTGSPLAPAGSWSTNAPGGLTDNGDGTASFDPAGAMAGTFNITYDYTDANGCSAVDVQSVTINAMPTAGIAGLSATYCDDESPVTLNGSPIVPVGTWSTTAPAGLTDNGDGTATFDPSLTTAGTWDVTYTYTDLNGCSDFETQSTTVSVAPTASFIGLAGPYCEDDATALLTGNQAPNGTFSGPGVTDNGNGTAIFDPAAAGAGSHTIIYLFTDGNGCSDSDSQMAMVNALPTVSISGLLTSFCIDAAAVVLTGSPIAPAGVWTTNAPGGLTDNGDGTAGFDPALATVGTWDVTYTYTDLNGCVGTETQSTTINALPVVNFSGFSGPYCDNDAVIALAGSPLTPAGNWGTTAPAGLTDNGDGTASFDPILATAGTWDVTYTYTDLNGCMSSDLQSVTINTATAVSFSGLGGPYCADAAIVNLTGSLIVPPGVWTTTAPAGLIDNGDGTATFNPALSTDGTFDVTYTYTNATGCDSFETQLVTVNPLPTVGITGLAPDYCVDAGVVNLNGSPTSPAGTWSTTAPAGLTDNGDGTADFDTSLAGAGSWDITYDYIDTNGCSGSQTESVLINPLPVVSIAGLAATYCDNETATAITGTPTDSNGSWSTNALAGLTDNSNGTANFDPSLAGAGSWDITYTYTDLNGCVASNTQSVTINATPVPTITGSSTICTAISSTETYSTEAGNSNYNWTITGGTIDAGQGTESVDVTWTADGSIEVSYTGPNGCSSPTTNVTVQVFASTPAPGTNSPLGICQGDSQPTFTVTNFSGQTINWYQDSGLSVLLFSSNTTGDFTPSAIQFDTNVVGATDFFVTQDITGCGEGPASTYSITVTGPSAPPSAITPINLCITDPNPTLSATGTNILWYSDAALTTQIGSGTSFLPSSTELDTTVPGSTSFFVTQNEGCGESASFQIVVDVSDIATPPSFATLADVCRGGPQPTIEAVGTNVLWHSSAAATDTLASGLTFTPNSGQLDTSILGSTQFFASQDFGCGRSSASTITVNVVDCGGSCFTVDAVSQAASCLNNDGSITLNLVNSMATSSTFELFIVDAGDTTFRVSQTGNFFDSLVSASYNYEILDNIGCTASGIVDVTQFQTTVDAEFNVSSIDCAGGMATVDVNILSGGVNPYEYSDDDGSSWQVLVNNQIEMPMGQHRILVRNDANDLCPDDSGPFTIDEPTLIEYSSESNASFPELRTGSLNVNNVFGGAEPYRIRLESISNYSTFQDGESIIIDFQDIPMDATTREFSIEFEDLFAGEYEVIVEDANLCSLTQILEVPLNDQLFIPNVFTPNGDNHNDTFFIRRPEGETTIMAIIITNRYGKKVFESQDYQNDWNADGQNDGVFYYSLKIGNESITGYVEVWRGL